MAEKYSCGYCSAEYDTPVERARCEFECDEKQKQEKERLRKMRLENERKARFKEAREAYVKFDQLNNSFQKDYGQRLMTFEQEIYTRNQFPL